MKSKRIGCAYLAATIFMVAYLSQPGLIARACWPSPSYARAVSVDQIILFPTVDESANPSVFDQGFDYGKSLWIESRANEKPLVIGLLIAFGVAVLVIGYIFFRSLRC